MIDTRALPLIALLISGCSHYWTRPQATLEQFAQDHRECIQAGAVPVVNHPNLVVPNEQEFRRCLIARGWSRREQPVTDVPQGYFRGYEERELEAVTITDLPIQPASAVGDTTSRAAIQPRPPEVPVVTTPPVEVEKSRLDLCREEYARLGARRGSESEKCR